MTGVRPIDTSQLGAIRCDPDADAVRARIVREALQALRNDPSAGWMFNALAQQASDEALARLGRLLK